MTIPRPATPPLLKRLNEEAVLETIRAGSPISRAEISRRAGISKPTVSLALQTLLEAGLVREAPTGPQGPSYGAIYFEPVAEAALVVGIDLGARFLRGAVSDLSGAVRARQDVELGGADADGALTAIAQLRDGLLDAAGLSTGLIDEVVVGVPGVVESPSGTVRLALNIPGLDGRRFGAELGERLGHAVTVENDVNLAALGEGRRGVARGVADYIFLSVGTGLGAGLVLRGELQRGHHGAAGELDYIRAGLEQELDPCAAALSRFAERLARADGSQTALVPPYDVRSVFAAARSGDAVADAVLAEAARRVAAHIAPIAAVTDVGLVVLGGGIGANAELLQGVRPLLAEWLPYPPRVEMSSLGDAAVLMGALAVGLRSALGNVFVSRRS
ncbi:MAG TPA: ROK family transcriptional regulator [Gaiellaceae bacterium]|nr:ROK family transcriptional regulator [Gaiellaceae bacterium]